jgi:hypothetical protein
MTSVSLTDDELAVLDGRCSAKVQVVVDGAKQRIEARDLYPVDDALAGFIADVVSEARRSGEVQFRHVQMSSCHICKQARRYATYKSGPRRGSPRFDKPLFVNGFEFAVRFVHMKGYPTLGACTDCAERARPVLTVALAGVEAEIPEPLRAPSAPIYKRHPRRECPECHWQGHEGEMGHLRTFMGDGTYPGKCPACGYESGPFKALFKTLEGFVVVAAPAAEPGQGEKA